MFFLKKLLNTKCVFWFSLQLFSETFLVLRRIERDMIINVHRSACKVPVILVSIRLNWNFLDVFSKIINYQISWISVQWEPNCSMWADGQTLRSYFAKAPKHRATVIGHNSASPDIRFPDVSKQYRGHIFRCLNVPEFFLGHLDTWIWQNVLSRNVGNRIPVDVSLSPHQI